MALLLVACLLIPGGLISRTYLAPLPYLPLSGSWPTGSEEEIQDHATCGDSRQTRQQGSRGPAAFERPVRRSAWGRSFRATNNLLSLTSELSQRNGCGAPLRC